MALDAGTTGVRAVAYDAQLGVHETAYEELTQYFPSPGWVEHDPPEIAAKARSVLSSVATKCHQNGHHVVALGLTNQRETTVAFDRSSGAVRHRALVWQDRRTIPQCEQLTKDGHLATVREKTGLVLDPYFSATKMRWLIENGALEGFFSPSLCTIDTYLLWHLTGGNDEAAYVSEPSNASRTLLFNLKSKSWDEELAKLFHIPLDTLARVQPSASHFGEVASQFVPELAGIPITGVLGDQQAALFGQACFRPGMVKATYGTGAFVLANAGEVVPSPVDGLLSTIAWDLGNLGTTTYALEGSAFVAGAAIQWLRDELHFVQHAKDVGPLASAVLDSGGVTFVPAFTGLGSPFWNPDAHGVLMGLSVGTSRSHIARAVVESLAFQVRAMTEAFVRGGIPLLELRADGGASSMDLLMELQATNSRVPVLRSTSLEATARGAAAIAGLGAGIWSSLEELERIWTSDFRVRPDDPKLVDAGYTAWLRSVERA
jgi:glycerol kinase